MSLTPEERRIRHKEANRRWRQKNPHYFKRWVKKNQRHIKKYRAEYHLRVRRANPEKLQTRRKTAYKKLREQVKLILGNICAWCGHTDTRVLCVDHIKGDGHIERKITKWWITLQNIRDFGAQGRYQLLCANCNLLKRIQNNENANVTPEGSAQHGTDSI